MPRIQHPYTGARQRAALAHPAPDTVAWHIRMRDCDGSADWVELGATKPSDIPPEADALPLVHAQTVVDEPSGDELATVYAMGLAAGKRAAAHPQQPARVPLTDAQILQLDFDNCTSLRMAENQLAFARAIERAHGIVPAPTTDKEPGNV